MWYILGGKTAGAVCIQDLSVFVLAIFGLGLNCIVEEGSDDDMFDDEEVKSIQEAFQPFYLYKLEIDNEMMQRCSNFSTRATDTLLADKKNTLTSTRNFKKTVIEIIEESNDAIELEPEAYPEQEHYQDHDDMIAEEVEEEENETERTQRRETHQTQQTIQEETDPEPEIEIPSRFIGAGRNTSKSKNNPADNSFMSRNPPKSYHSGTSSPMLLLDVNLGGGRIERVMMHEGDDPQDIADKIIRENSSLLC